MRIVIDFAGQRIPATLSQAKVPDPDGFATNVTCLHTRAGAVAFGASVVVLWRPDSCVDVDAEFFAEGKAKRLRDIGYQNVRIEQEIPEQQPS